MRRTTLSISLLLVIALLGPVAAASEIPFMTLHSQGSGEVAGWTEASMWTNVCISVHSGGDSVCNFHISGISLTPTSETGATCEGFRGSGGRGRLTDQSGIDAELSEVSFTLTSPRIPSVVQDEYLVTLQGNYTREGVTRPFVGDMVWQMGRACRDDNLTGAFIMLAEITLL